jgi:hypothetical protein
VADNVLSQVEADLEFGVELQRATRTRLDGLGFANEAELCAEIRSGSLDDRLPEVAAVIRAGLVDRLRVTNPSYLSPADAAP